MKILHLSDLHIGEGESTENTKLLFEKIKVNYKDEKHKPVIIITGDVIDDGEKRQFEMAKKLIDDMRENGYLMLLSPGNHDYGWNGIMAFSDNISRFGKYFKMDTDYPAVTRSGDFYFISIDSMEEEFEALDFISSEGEIGVRQLKDLEYHLIRIREENKNAKIIVYLHHHPFYYNFFMRIKDADDFKEVIKDRVNILLFGHKHSEKKFVDKEKKYGINLILAASKSTRIKSGSDGLKGKTVFRFMEVDADTFQVIPVEVQV